MLKGTKERPASADDIHGRQPATNITSPMGTARNKLGRSNTAGAPSAPLEAHGSGHHGSHSGRSSTRMFRKSENSPSPGRKTRRSASPDRSSSRPSAADHVAVAVGAGTGHGTTILVSGKGQEVSNLESLFVHLWVLLGYFS